MSNLTILSRYAQADPATIPNSILFSHTATSLTIYDAFPKSIFHFLLLPRIAEPQSTSSVLANLRSLLKGDKAQAREIVTALSEDAAAIRKEIECEMTKRYGFKWDIWIGFHGVPSMEHLHLHVISADLCSPKMKNKKHYNSFHPKLGFFLDIDEVLGWFDAEQSYFASVSKLLPTTFLPILKKDLSCWRCDSVMKNMPTLKAHLQEEWDNQSKAEKLKKTNVTRAVGRVNTETDNANQTI